MKLSILIPVLNEEKTIKKVIERVLLQKSVFEIIVIDDGSTDDTLKKLNNIKNPKLKILKHQKNLGKGAAIQTALKKVIGDYILTQDGDLEYNPDEYIKLIKKASPSKAVYGSRIKGNNPHAYTRTYLGNTFITALANFLFGTNLTDSYTCYKLIPTKLARNLYLKSSGFEIEAEITGKLAKGKTDIIEVPISFSPRKYEEGKKIKFKDAILGTLTYLKIWLGF